MKKFKVTIDYRGQPFEYTLKGKTERQVINGAMYDLANDRGWSLTRIQDFIRTNPNNAQVEELV